MWDDAAKSPHTLMAITRPAYLIGSGNKTLANGSLGDLAPNLLAYGCLFRRNDGAIPFEIAICLDLALIPRQHDKN